jgi:hypothetical protein
MKKGTVHIGQLIKNVMTAQGRSAISELLTSRKLKLS